MKTRRMMRTLSGMGMLSIAISGVMTFQTNETMAQRIREVPVPGMRGIASVGYRGNELTVEYNPRVCARLGPDLCSFFRAHEYGHIAMRHLERGTPVRQAEYEADLWAARNSSPAARAAAVRFFNSGRGGSFIHGSGRARANRIASTGSMPTQASFRQDGTRVLNRGYSAISSRPFNTAFVRRPLFRRWRR